MSKTDAFAHIHLFKGGFMDKTRLRDILKLGTPVFLGMIVQNLVNITDNWMVGKMGSWYGDQYPHLVLEATNGLAALGPATMFVWLVAGLFACINVGTQAMVSRREGEKRFDAAGLVVFNSTTVGFLSGIAVAIVGSIYLVPEVFPIFHNNPEVQRLGTAYCVVRFYSIPAWVATFGIKAFWDGIGKTHIHMTAAVVMTLMNLVLNFVLIFGIPSVGLEPMGVLGAAWGSTIGTYIGFFVVLAWLFKKKYREKYGYFSNRKWKGEVIGEVYRISLPSGIANIAIMTGFLFFTKIAGYLDDHRMLQTVETNVAATIQILEADVIKKIPKAALERMKPEDRQALPASLQVLNGELKKLQADLPAMVATARANTGLLFNDDREKISTRLKDIVQKKTPPILNPYIRPISYNSNGAATTVVISIAMICFIGILGFGQATATLVGQSLGRKQPDIAQKYGFESVTMLTGLYAVLGLITFIFPGFFIGIFSDDPLVIEAATWPVRIWAIVELGVCSAMILPQCLFAAGQSMFVMLVEMALHFICLIPLTYIFAVTLDWGITGLWSAAGIYVYALALVMIIKFAGHSWMSSELRG